MEAVWKLKAGAEVAPGFSIPLLHSRSHWEATKPFGVHGVSKGRSLSPQEGPVSAPIPPQNCGYKREPSRGSGDSHHHGVGCGAIGADARTLGRGLQATFILQSGVESQLCIGHWSLKGRSEAAFI